MWHVYHTGKVHAGFEWKDVMERVYFEEVGIVVRIIFKWVFKKCNRLDCSGPVLG
jgi:hypothetical protein